MCTTSCHWPTSSAKLIQSTPSNPISLAAILILSSHLHLCFQWSYCFMFPNQNPAGISILPPACHMHYLCHHVSVKVRLDQWEIISVKTVRGRREFVTESSQLIQQVQPAGACWCYLLSNGCSHTVAMSVNDSRINLHNAQDVTRLHNVQHVTRLHLQARKVKLTLRQTLT